MNADDVLDYLAKTPRASRPYALRSDTAMLLAWQKLRKDKAFYFDVIERHNLKDVVSLDEEKHEHAIGNAWAHTAAGRRG